MTTRLRALIYALLALLVGGLAYLLGVGSFIGQRAEASVLDASAFEANPAGPLQFVSTATVLIAIAIVSLIALWVHGIARALVVAASSGFTILAAQVLKKSWLDRPQLFEFDAVNTFPSGHMTVYAVLIGALLWAVPSRARGVVMLGGSVLLGVVSWQLLEYGWHRPSDLIGAQALAVCAFAIAALLGPIGTRTRQRARGLSGYSRIVSKVVTISGIAVLVGSLALLAYAAISRSDDLMLIGGEVALIAVSLLSVRTMANLCP